MRPNWFVAWPVVLDDAFELPPPPSAVRVFHPADRHITAAFLGPCGEADAIAVFEEAQAIEVPVVRGTLGRVAALGPPKRPSTLAALIEDGNEAFAQIMAARRDDWLRRVGKGPDRWPVLPHCTLARATRRATDPQREAALEWGHGLATSGVGFQVHPLALYTWSQDRKEQLFQIWKPDEKGTR